MLTDLSVATEQDADQVFGPALPVSNWRSWLASRTSSDALCFCTGGGREWCHHVECRMLAGDWFLIMQLDRRWETGELMEVARFCERHTLEYLVGAGWRPAPISVLIILPEAQRAAQFFRDVERKHAAELAAEAAETVAMEESAFE
jgi:hypothetical protein